MFQGMLRAYERTLDLCLKFKSVVLMVTLATIAGTVWLYIIVPKGFFPTEDTGFMLGITEGATDISFPAMAERQRQVADLVRADKAVAYVNSTVGAGGPNSTANSGRMLIALKDKSERREIDDRREPALAPRRQCGARHSDFFPADPEREYRRPAVEEPVSIHAAIERHRFALPDRTGNA